MNVRKRGLALLMCICMIFTLLPFSAFADASADKSVVYGKYDNGTWTQDDNAKDTVTYDTEGGNTLSLTKTAKRTADNTYDITLKVVSTQTETTTKPGSAATVLVMDVSGSMDICATCNNSEQHSDWDGNYWFEHSKDCNTGKTGIVEYSETRLKAAKDAAYDFILSYSGAVLEDGQVTGLKNNAADGLGRYVSVVRFSTNSSVACEWKDVSTVAGYDAVKAAIDGLNADGGTNLDAGLRTANAQFNDEAVKDITAKNVIALTDGMPTFYVGGDSDGNHGSYGCPDTNAATAKSATALKASASVYTVCFGAANEKCWTKDSAHAWTFKLFVGNVVTERHQDDGPKVGDFLRKSIATSETGKTYAYNANNTTELMAAFKAITSSITEGIKTGTVLDPMGDHITVTSKPDNFVETPTGYKWELSNPTVATDGGKTTYTYELTYTVTFDPNFGDFDENSYYAANKETTFTAGGKVYNFNVPGVKGTAPSYMVTYKYANAAPEGATDVATLGGSYKKDATVTVADKPSVDGWTFSGWSVANDSPTKPTITNDQFNMPNGNVVLEGSWTQNSYTVTYQPGDHGTFNNEGTSVNQFEYVGKHYGDATPAAPTTDANSESGTIVPNEGYYFTGWEPTRAETVTGNATYTAQYEKLNNLSYTVHYYLNGTTQKVKDDKVVDGKTFEEEVTETYATIDGYTFAGTADEQTKTITIGVDVENNKIIFYYYKNVTVTPNNANKTYGEDDPDEFTATVSGLINETDSLTYAFTRAPGENVGGYEIHKSTGDEVQGYYKVTYETGVFNITKRDVTFTGETGTKPYTSSTIELTGITNVGLIEGHCASNLTYSASGINVGGPYSGAFNVGANDVKIIDAENKDVSGNYNITLVPGSLTIVKADAVIVKITGKTDTKVYNGLNQTFTGYDFVIENNLNNAYKATDFSLKTDADVTASGTNVGEYTMGLTEDSFVNNNANFDVKFVIVKDGSLTITKRPLTIIGENSDPSEITYDGQTHTYTSWSLAPAADNSGLVSGHQITGITYLLTGKNAGDYTGQFSGDAKIMSGEEDVTANYSIEYAPGMMKIVPAEKIAVKIIGNHKEVWYNGQEQSVSGFTFEVADNTVTVELKAGHYAIAKGTNVKTYYMGLKSDDFTINHKNYKEVSVEIVDGYLTIKRHYTPNPPIMDEIIVEITGNSDSVVYDGTEHSVKDYTVKISDPRYTEADFTFTGKAEASGVNAGTYEMGLKAEQFKNTNARFTNVKFVIKADGVLTITPKELIITAGSKTEYGPTPVTCDEWTVSGLAAGDKVESVKITGIQSVPGSSPNVPSDAVIKNAKGEDVTKNYAIKYVNGTLTMLEVLNKEDHFNYIIGTPEGLSLPTANVTRAEVATIFFRLMTDDARAKFDSLDNNFSDVAKGQWYNRAISTLANAGIIKGDPAGTYRPGDAITRAEMAAIIARFGDFKEGGKTFNDISGHWAQKYIELAASNGWINGNPDGTFKPNNNITRAETVAMINRVLDRQTKDVSDLLPVSQMTNWSDNMDTAKWYYRDMQEATNNHKAERVGNSEYEKWTEKLPDIDWASYQI